MPGPRSLLGGGYVQGCRGGYVQGVRWVYQGSGCTRGRVWGYTRKLGIPEEIGVPKGVGIPEGVYQRARVGIREVRGCRTVCIPTPPRIWDLGYPSLSTDTNTYGWQAGSTHLTGMLSCFNMN